MVLNENVKWVCFHGSFDFAYFLRLLLNTELPKDSTEFSKLRRYYFPKVIDIKYMLKDHVEYNQDGLNKLASQLKVHHSHPGKENRHPTSSRLRLPAHPRALLLPPRKDLQRISPSEIREHYLRHK